jgi:prophage regulatory protein
MTAVRDLPRHRDESDQTRESLAEGLRQIELTIRHQSDRLLGVDDVIRRTTLSRSAIHELEGRGEFPRRRRISANKVGWLESEIAEWIATLPKAEP